jgi:hypothetical protein
VHVLYAKVAVTHQVAHKNHPKLVAKKAFHFTVGAFFASQEMLLDVWGDR